MNREIEFRGKHNDTWLYGYLLKDEGKYYIAKHSRLGSWYYVISETIGQYTGLKDKNGKKIFEGDIVKVNEYYKGIGETDLLYKVEYIDRLAKFVFNPIIVNGKYDNNNHDVDLFTYEINDIKVIGNIYENDLESKGE